jgi:predicted ATPase
MIHRVCIKNYKSFSELNIRLRPLTVLMGPNAVGKSNFLDGLQLLSNFVTSKNLNSAFATHRGLPLECIHGWKGYKLSEQVPREFLLEVDVSLSDELVDYVESRIREMRRLLNSGNEHDAISRYDTTPARKPIITERYLRYSIAVRIDSQTGHLGVINEKACALMKNLQREKKRKPFLERTGEKIHLRMEGQAHPLYHDLGLDYAILSTPFYWPHYPHLAALKEELSRWRFYYLEPRTLMREANPLREVAWIEPKGEQLAAFYNTLRVRNEKQYRNAILALRQVIPRFSELQIDPTPAGLLLLSVKEDGIPYSARMVSEGTLRLLGLAAILNPLSAISVIGYEEPENGVHPHRIQIVAKWLRTAADRGMQMLITTHSPYFAQLLADQNSLFVCTKQEGQTQIKPYRDFFGKTGLDAAFQEKVVMGEYGG